MNADSTDNGSVTFEFTNQYDVPAHAASVSITEPKECKSPFCTNTVALWGDYCSLHRRDKPRPTNDDPILTGRTSGPSNRKLQRQLDRIEGKLDALIAALLENDNE